MKLVLLVYVTLLQGLVMAWSFNAVFLSRFLSLSLLEGGGGGVYVVGIWQRSKCKGGGKNQWEQGWPPARHKVFAGRIGIIYDMSSL